MAWVMAAGLDRRRLELYLPAAASAIAQARRAVDRLEALDPHPDARFSVRLLVSEVFTNAVKYGADGREGRVRLAIEVSPATVRVEIGDRGAGFAPGPAPMPDAERESGRGLAFLDALATRWGIVRAGETSVWFEVDL